MTLDLMLAAHDESALAALANTGLLRRALRDCDAGLAKVVDRNTQSALIEVDGLSLRIDDTGPKPADCPCAATTICRHLITAILTLRATAPTPDEQVSAQDALLAMSDNDIIKFAGSDLQAALVLATLDADITQDGASLRVTLPDMAAPVLFFAGRSLKEAVFKGPASRYRLAVAAGVLAARNKFGIALDVPATAEADTKDILLEPFLKDVSDALERLLMATITGGASMCLDHMFDLAISARAQAAPRLTATLRGLVTQANLSIDRHVSFELEKFAASVARCYALIFALKKSPNDPILKGVLQRDYSSASPINALVFGASAWHAGSGARGMRVFCYDTDSASWVTAGQARAGGADPTFTPHRAYELSLLGAASAHALIGHHLNIAAPRLSVDGQLAPTVVGTTQHRMTMADLHGCDALFDNWHNARDDIARRTTQGLKHSGESLPILLEPMAIKREGFDDFAQTYRFNLVDGKADKIPLLVPAKDKDLAKWLEEVGGKLRALLCVTTADPHRSGLAFSPVAAVLSQGDHVQICNFSFDLLPWSKSLFKVINRAYAGQLVSIAPTRDPLITTRDQVIGHLMKSASMGTKLQGPLRKMLEAQGLSYVLDAVVQYDHQPTPANLLRAVYLADRVAAQTVVS
jgi:hypothetical protein